MIHDVSLKLLDAFYLRRTHILEELCRSATEEVQCRDITLLGADYLLLATAIILAASQVLNNEMSHKVCELMSHVIANYQPKRITSNCTRFLNLNLYWFG